MLKLQKHGIRAKVKTEDNNEIDTLFFDRRNIVSNNGKTLVRFGMDDNLFTYPFGQ